MIKRRTLVWLIAAAFAICLILVATVPRMPTFRFLERQKPLGEEIWKTRVGHHVRLRLYSWKQPWKEVVQQSKSEFEKLGFRLTGSEDNVYWYLLRSNEFGPHKIDVWINPGHYTSLDDTRKRIDTNPDWVNVTVSRDAEIEWLNAAQCKLLNRRCY